jgi:Tfp pilus assembly protein PilV
MGRLMFNKYSNTGSSVIEVLVAVGIFIIIAVTSLSAIIGATNIGRLTQEQTEASQLAQQGYEATVSIRNNDWTNLANGTYGLNNTGSQWVFSGSSDVDVSGKFTRTVTIESVNRDGNNAIVTSGGTADPDTKKITINVAWSPSPTRNNNIQFVSYLTNWQFTSFTGTSGGGGGPTPVPTIAPTAGPTPTPGVSATCAPHCISQSYSTGTCRQNTQQCNNNGETYEAGGNGECQVPNSDTCCCAP